MTVLLLAWVVVGALVGAGDGLLRMRYDDRFRGDWGLPIFMALTPLMPMLGAFALPDFMADLQSARRGDPFCQSCHHFIHPKWGCEEYPGCASFKGYE